LKWEKVNNYDIFFKHLYIEILGIIINNAFSWKSHIDMITPKLSQACYIVRVVKPFLSWDTLKIMYYAFFHSVMTYGIKIWGNSSHSDNIFRLKKRITVFLIDNARVIYTKKV